MNIRHLLTVSTLVLTCSLTAHAADAGHAPMKGACKQDVAKLCEGIKPGGGRIADCLKAHKDQVSDTCKAAIKQGHAHRKGDKGGQSAPAGEPGQ